jgi:acyl carrier protein
MKDQIRSYLSENAAGGDVSAVGDGDSLLEAGILDSVMMVDLVGYLERTYGIAVDEDDMVPENFDSVSAIAEYVARKRLDLSAN